MLTTTLSQVEWVGVQFRTRLDSRRFESLTVPREIEGLKHAGMTDFGMVTMVTQQATGNRPEEIEKQILF